MSTYPKDPMILLSWTNMKLRDFYSDLDDLCQSLDIDRNELETLLETAGFTYDRQQNRFK
jgi:CBS-domain-containing membrane protein